MTGEIRADGVITPGDGTRRLDESFHVYFDRFRPYMRIKDPYIFPLDKYPDSVPAPNVELLGRLQKGENTVDHLKISLYRTASGHVAPMPQFIDGEKAIPLLACVPVGKYQDHLRAHVWKDDILTPEDIAYMRRVYQYTGAITQGADAGLETARMLQAHRVMTAYTRSGKRPWQLSKTLTRQYGLSLSPDKYEKWFRTIDSYLKNRSPERLANARQIVAERPGIFLAYLIDTITQYSPWLEQKWGMGFIEVIGELYLSAQEANVGRVTDRDTLVNADINMAIVTLQELWTASKYPYVYALANEVVTRKTGLPQGSRLSSLFATKLHDTFAVGDGIVPLSSLEQGSVILRANIKSASSLITEVLYRGQSLADDIYSIADSLGIGGIRSEESTSGIDRARGALDIFNTLLQYADEHELDSNTDARLRTTINDIVHRMDMQNELIRSRAYFQNPSDLDYSVEKARQIIESYPTQTKETNPEGIKTWAHAAIDTPNKHWSRAFTLQEIRDAYEQNPQYPSFFTWDMIRRSPDDASVVFLFYLHVPCMFKIDASGVRLERISPNELPLVRASDIVWAEVQLAMSEIEGLANMHRFIYNRREQGIQTPHRVPHDLNDVLLQRAKDTTRRKDTRRIGKLWPIEYKNIT